MSNRRAAGRGHIRTLAPWGLTAVVWGAAAALAGGPLRDTAALPAPARIPWWGLAGLFAVAELCVMHIHVRSDAHTVSLSEIPLALGLVFSAPFGLVAAQALGGGLVLAVHRRQAPRKLALNIGLLALSPAVAALTLRAVLMDRQPVTPQGWGAITVAAAAAAAVGAVVVAAAIAIAQPGGGANTAMRIVVNGVVGSIAVTSLALALVTVVWFQPLAVVLLIVPLGAVFLGYRAFSTQRDRAERLEFLYDAGRRLQEAVDVEEAVRRLLSRTIEMFHAELGELTLFPASGEVSVYRSRVGRGDEGQTMAAAALDAVEEELVVRLGDTDALLLRPGTAGTAGDAFLRQRDLKDAMLVALRGEVRVGGTMLVGNRLGDIGSFTEEDLRLLATLAGNAGIALENGRLERSVSRLVEIEQQLRRQVFHDPVTGLPNRLQFGERLAGALRRRGGHAAVLLVDLDGFRAVSDRVGHSGADAVLSAVAGRLRALVRPPDLVARVGGFEFAVLLGGLQDGGAPLTVAERVVAALRHPVVLPTGEEVLVHASIGVVPEVDPAAGVTQVLDDAAAAAVRARATGRSAYAVFTTELRAHPVVARGRPRRLRIAR